jgi:succinoglycan biosynthesis transport protein ExoP
VGDRLTDSKPFSVAPYSLAPYVDVLYRHRRAALGLFAGGVSITLCLVALLRDVYVASAAIMIEPPRVEANYLSAATDRPENIKLADQLEAVAQTAFTDTWLQQLIVRFGLYNVRSATDHEHGSLDRLVKYMRQKMTLVVPPDTIHWDGSHAEGTSPVVLTISFEYRDRFIAQRVAAELARRFIQEGQKERTERVTDAERFLETQVTHARAGLDQKAEEKRVIEQRYQGSLPEDLPANLEQLDRLEEQLRMIDERMELNPAVPTRDSTNPTPEEELASLESKLTRLGAEYSDEYPDVVELKAEIANLKLKVSSGSMNTREKRVTNEDSPYQARLGQEAAAINQKIQSLQQNIAAAPEHGQTIGALSRDYDALSAEYHQLLQKQMAAELRRNLDKRQQDERLQLLNPVSLPRVPKSPNRVAIGTLGILFSLGAALLLPFGLFFTDTSYKTPEEVESDYGIRVTAAIPIVDEEKEQRRETIQALVLSCSSVLIIAGTLLAYARWFRS